MIKIGRNENDIFQLWKKWHDSHSIDSDPKLCSSIEPKNNKIRCGDIYSIKFKSNILAIFSFDINQNMENRNENIVHIDDILLNPDIDFSISIKAIADYFQKEGWCEAKFGCNLIYHHPYITDVFKDQGFKLNTCDYLICLRSYSIKGDNKLSIKLLENKHETNCSIYKFVDDTKFLKDYGQRANNTVSSYFTCEAEYLCILLDKPLFYIKNVEDIVFELRINDIKYKYCDCSTEHPHTKKCLIGHEYRRLNKLEKIEISGYDREKDYRYTLLFGMIVPKDTESFLLLDGQLLDRKVMLSKAQQSHKNITPVSYHFSEWIKQFPQKKYKVKGIPVSKCMNIPLKNLKVKGIPVSKCVVEPLYEIKVDENIPECDLIMSGLEISMALFDQIQKDIDIESSKIGYNYLVQEREHVNTKTNVYKQGMTTQYPDTQIDRIRQGYKKGSLMLLIISCEPKDAKIREQKIKKAFNEKFEQHPDGPEHFIGDCNEMMKIMMDIAYGDFTVHQVQEQQKQIDSLKSENELLKKQLFDLQKTTDICK